jgi:preprotein translocase subunit YajC
MPFPVFDPGASTHASMLVMFSVPTQPSSGLEPAAQSTLEPGDPGASPQPAPAPGWLQTLYSLGPLILIFIVFYFFIIGGNRRKEKERAALISSLSRGDRVTTIGGIIGNVVDATGDEVVLKVDENNNTKIRITRSAVASVTKGEGR